MSDQPANANTGGGQLFKKIDEQERIYAPEQVPGEVHDPDEVDAGGTAASGTAAPAQEGVGARADTGSHGETIAGADGDQGTVPVVGVRTDVSMANPMPLPATTDEHRLSSGDTTDRS